MAKKRILIVDDQMDWRLLVRMTLDEYDIEIVEADDGAKGVTLAESSHPDLIIMDNNMPQLSGYEAIKKIKSGMTTRAIPIIMLTSKGFDSQMREMIKLDVNEFFSKPFDENALIAAIEKNIGNLQPKAEKLIGHGQKAVMFVENPVMRDSITGTLKDTYKLFEVKTKEELLEKMSREKPELVIMDVSVADFRDNTSVEILNFALANGISVVIDLSQLQNEGLQEIMRNKGTTLFTLKPFRMQELAGKK